MYLFYIWLLVEMNEKSYSLYLDIFIALITLHRRRRFNLNALTINDKDKHINVWTQNAKTMNCKSTSLKVLPLNELTQTQNAAHCTHIYTIAPESFKQALYIIHILTHIIDRTLSKIYKHPQDDGCDAWNNFKLRSGHRYCTKFTKNSNC